MNNMLMLIDEIKSEKRYSMNRMNIPHFSLTSIVCIKNTVEESSRSVSNLLVLILSLCKRLIDLNFCDLFPTKYWFRVCILPLTSYMSSTLIKLKINVVTLTDCLFLLDGRLDCLSTLIVSVSQISSPFDVERTVSVTSITMF